nr:MAG TPA: hypothetical protein [Caudoviricetes sp.]
MANHYPDVPNYGDMTTLPERILSGEIEAPDILATGSNKADKRIRTIQ